MLYDFLTHVLKLYICFVMMMGVEPKSKIKCMFCSVLFKNRDTKSGQIQLVFFYYTMRSPLLYYIKKCTVVLKKNLYYFA